MEKRLDIAGHMNAVRVPTSYTRKNHIIQYAILCKANLR